MSCNLDTHELRQVSLLHSFFLFTLLVAAVRTMNILYIYKEDRANRVSAVAASKINTRTSLMVASKFTSKTVKLI